MWGFLSGFCVCTFQAADVEDNVHILGECRAKGEGVVLSSNSYTWRRGEPRMGVRRGHPGQTMCVRGAGCAALESPARSWLGWNVRGGGEMGCSIWANNHQRWGLPGLVIFPPSGVGDGDVDLFCGSLAWRILAYALCNFNFKSGSTIWEEEPGAEM